MYDELEEKICKALMDRYNNDYNYHVHRDRDIVFSDDNYKSGFHRVNGRYIIMYENDRIRFANPDYFDHKYDPDLLILIGMFFRDK